MQSKDKHIENHPDYKGLKVNEGIDRPAPVNEASVRRFLQNRRRQPTAAEYVEGILKGDITMLSRAVTMVESVKPEHQMIAREVISECLPYSGKSLRVGITGVPGAGKSTFIEALGKMITREGHKLAVLAIDPSSERSRGSILGDKTRMEELIFGPVPRLDPWVVWPGKPVKRSSFAKLPASIPFLLKLSGWGRVKRPCTA